VVNRSFVSGCTRGHTITLSVVRWNKLKFRRYESKRNRVRGLVKLRLQVLERYIALSLVRLEVCKGWNSGSVEKQNASLRHLKQEVREKGKNSVELSVKSLVGCMR